MTDSCHLYSRRQFILGLGAAIVAASCSSKTITVYKQDPTTTTTSMPTTSTTTSTIPAGTMAPTDRTLVVLELGGGNDALSMVVPHANPRYYDLRKATAIDNPIDLDGEIGLHPNLPFVSERYQAGNVAIVQGVGIHDPDLSHFTSQRRWWDGTDHPDNTGWLGRYLDATVGYEDLLGGITIGPGPSQAMLGNGSFVVNIADSYGLGSEAPWWMDDPEELFAAWAGFAPVDVPLGELSPLQRAISATVTARKDLNTALLPLRDAIDREEKPELDEGFTRNLRLAANLIVSDQAPNVIYIHGYGDFDTHDEQVEVHGRMMEELNAGLSEFFSIIEAGGASDRTVLMTTSEFGRRPKDNDNGTDHGTASTQFVIGASVKGGRYGEPPSLTRLDEDDNLIHTVDFRSSYATMLEGWLGGDAETILRDTYETFPMF